ncbi:helix-turn-helix domain-containing protein [Pontibacter silvestris]
MTLRVIIEVSGQELWGRIEGIGRFMPTTVGSSKKEVLDNLLMLIADYRKHEGQEDEAWGRIDPGQVAFEFAYDLQDFFQEYSILRQEKVAELSGIHPELLRQYASGEKYPLAEHAMKIEHAIHALARALLAVSVYAA